MRYLVLMALIASSCAQTNSKPVYLGFTADSNAIVLKNMDREGLYQLQQDSDRLDSMQVIDVVETPAADDSLSIERTVAGRVRLKGDSLVFVPDTPFSKGRTYRAQSYVNAAFAKGGTVLKGNMKLRVQPVVVELTR